MFGALLVRRIRPWSERKAARPRDCALPLTEKGTIEVLAIWGRT